MNNIGLQLYSFGSEGNLSVLERIKKAGEMGYTNVEFAGGYEGIPAGELKKALEAAGVTAKSAHVQLESMEKDIPYLHELGTEFAICPMAAFNSEAEARELSADLNRYAKLAEKYGMKVGYHNHTGEFYMENGKYLFDILMENTDPETVVFELDCGWASAAGVDPVEYINAHAGRIAGIHIKENNAVIGADMPASRYDPPQEFELDKDGRPVIPAEIRRMWEEREKLNVPQGSGIINWKAVKAAAEAQNKNVIFVLEREASYGGKDRITCLKEDIAWIKSNL